MKTCKYLQESLNFIVALQQIKQERGFCSPSTLNGKQQSRKKDCEHSPTENCVGRVKYTKRNNLNLRQLLEQYIENSENDYVLTLGIGRVQNKKHLVFDVWLSELSQKQHNNIDIESNIKINESKTYSQFLKKQNHLNQKKQQKKNQNYNSKLVNYDPFSTLHKLYGQKNKRTLQRQSIQGLQQQEQNKDDEVVHQLDELCFNDKQIIIKQRLIEQVNLEISQNQKQNAGPTHNRQQKQKEIKGLQFSKIKRYKSTKRKIKLQI